jgi:hypothetical protein
MISCDTLFIQRDIQRRLQERVGGLLADFDGRKLVLNATHTHTGPGFIDSTFKGLYDVSNDAGVMKASEYGDFFIERVAEAAVQAWRSRQPAAMGWAMSQAVVAFNRRAHFFNGSTVMYGNTGGAGFSSVEGYSDHAVKLLFFWNDRAALSGVVINLACPSQATEHLNEISADFWHEVRLEVRRRHGPDLFIFPQCAPSGDQSPHPIYRRQAEQLMDQRRGLTRRQEIARRIADAVDDALPLASKDIRGNPLFRHTVATLELPQQEPARPPFYETDPVRPITFHVLRLGDVAIATNPFELYLDYGIRIEARSRPPLTMMVQLSGASCGYLPTERAVQGGGYSADRFIVGPAGGQVLVEETVRQINELWR